MKKNILVIIGIIFLITSTCGCIEEESDLDIYIMIKTFNSNHQDFSAKIFIDDIYVGMGSYYGKIEKGSHQVSFEEIIGYQNPKPQEIDVKDEDIEIEGGYFLENDMSEYYITIKVFETINGAVQVNGDTNLPERCPILINMWDSYDKSLSGLIAQDTVYVEKNNMSAILGPFVKYVPEGYYDVSASHSELQYGEDGYLHPKGMVKDEKTIFYSGNLYNL